MRNLPLYSAPTLASILEIVKGLSVMLDDISLADTDRLEMQKYVASLALKVTILKLEARRVSLVSDANAADAT